MKSLVNVGKIRIRQPFIFFIHYKRNSATGIVIDIFYILLTA